MPDLTAIAEDAENELTADAATTGGAGTPAPPVAASATIHRLRDLDRRARWVAVLFAAALLLAPVLAFAWAAPQWAPASDPALMALRSLDVGTPRHPLTGQPSTSSAYDGDLGTPHVHHLGPLHFYLMAIPVRLLGAALGMLVVSLAIVAASVLLSAWAVFRQLGPRGGVVAAVAIGAITYTTGAASLVNPVSSNIAGYPVLCSMVLLWCLLCGDLRLLPLAVAVVSFAAQQHLSVVPALAVAVVLVVTAVGVASGRRLRDPAVRSRFARWSVVATAVGLVVWAPVLIQQLFGDEPNLTALAKFTRDSDRSTIGWGAGARQVANVLAWPPILGRDRVTGNTLLEEASVTTWLSAGLVIVAAGAVGWWWWRGSQRRRAALVAMVAVLAVGGLVSGSSVPDSLEQGRIALYQWVWPLAFFVVVTFGLALADGVRRWVPGAVAGRWLRPVGATTALLAVVVSAVLSSASDRPSNNLSTAYSPVERRSFDALGDQVMARSDDLGHVTVVLERGGELLDGFGPGLTVELTERGVDVRLSHWTGGQGVHADRLVDPDTVDSGLVLAMEDPSEPRTEQIPGERIAAVSTSGFDQEAFEELVAAAETGEPVRFGDDLEAYLASEPEEVAALRGFRVASLTEDARPVLSDPDVLDILLRYPPEYPRLDHDLMEQLLESFPDPGLRVLDLEVYLLDRDELLDYATAAEIPRDG